MSLCWIWHCIISCYIIIILYYFIFHWELFQMFVFRIARDVQVELAVDLAMAWNIAIAMDLTQQLQDAIAKREVWHQWHRCGDHKMGALQQLTSNFVAAPYGNTNQYHICHILWCSENLSPSWIRSFACSDLSTLPKNLKTQHATIGTLGGWIFVPPCNSLCDLCGPRGQAAILCAVGAELWSGGVADSADSARRKWNACHLSSQQMRLASTWWGASKITFFGGFQSHRGPPIHFRLGFSMNYPAIGGKPWLWKPLFGYIIWMHYDVRNAILNFPSNQPTSFGKLGMQHEHF